MHCAALRGPAVSLIETVGALGNVSACRNIGKPFVMAASYINKSCSSHIPETSPEKHGVRFQNLSTDCM